MRYEYVKAAVDESKLRAEITALATPVPGFTGALGAGAPGTNYLWIDAADNLSAADLDRLTAVVVAHVKLPPRRKRSIFAIYTDIGLLSTTKQNATWADITSGNPPKWALASGPNAAAIAAVHWSAANSGTAAAAIQDAKKRLVAMYVQDNITYLVNPPFDATINIPGDEAIP